MTNQLRVLDHTGDTKIEWNPSNHAETEAAREHFNRLKGKGFLAYRVEDDHRGEAIREFDPNAAQIMMSPQMAGG